jgi:hypothetical protein
MKNKTTQILFILFSTFIVFFSCSKNDSTPAVPDSCSGININVEATASNTSACLNNGSITVTASGSTGFQYSIDGSNFQPSNVFINLAKGTYTVTVKNGANCRKTAQVTLNESSGTPGPLFTAVKQLIQVNCVSCHSPGGQKPVPNLTIDCDIVQNASLINTRVVVLGTMPPTGALSQPDKDKITNWLAAGGKIEN